MPAFEVHSIPLRRFALGVTAALLTTVHPCLADKPTGAPLVLSTIETEQPVPLAYIDLEGKAHCTEIRLHWNPNTNLGPDDDATSFSLDLPSENPSAPIFTAQLWNASLASAMAWQEPWQGARWKVIQTPVTDGTGIDAGLAVGMIATSARRPYPPKTVVIGSLNPDGSLGPVTHLLERLDAAAAAGISRAIIPSVQRFDTDASGQIVNMVRHANDEHLECVAVDNLVEATETTMNDPLPDSTPDSTTPKYSNEVTNYIDGFARREQSEMDANLRFAPKEADIARYPARQASLATIWKSVYADAAAGRQAYRAGQVYMAYRFFCRANGSMSGVNAMVGQSRASFDVKAALSESDDLRNHLHTLMNPPSIDKGELQSAVLVAEMADWAYEINASLEDAQLVTKQTFSQRTDATEAEKDRAREAILFSIERNKYLLNRADFYQGLLAHIGKGNPLSVDENASRLLPQLVPAQLATARIFTDGIRERANDLRDGLLFDPMLAAYINVLRDAKTEWNARQRKMEMEMENQATAPANGTSQGTNPVKPNSDGSTGLVAFDPANTYAAPHTTVAPTLTGKKLSNAALCLIWANHDCEIAILDEKYLRLSGAIDTTTREWHVKDRAKLDALLQTAEAGAREGITLATKAGVDPSVLAMIYERAAHAPIQNDDASALEALRNYWRCALLGNMCWQLAHTHKAQPVDLTNDKPPAAKPDDKAKPQVATTGTDKNQPPVTTNIVVNPPVATNVVVKPAVSTNVVVNPPVPQPSTHLPAVVGPPAPIAVTPATNVVTVADPPVAPIAHDPNEQPPRALPVDPNLTSPEPANDTGNIPVAPIVHGGDGMSAPPATNAVPVIGPMPPPPPATHDNSDGHANAFP